MYEGQITFTEAASQHQLHVPFSVYVGEQYDLDAITDLDFDPLYLSNSEGGHGTKVYYAVNQQLKDYMFGVYGFDENDELVLAGIIDKPEFDKALDPFYYSFDWDGTVYSPEEGKADETIKLDPEGIYAMVPFVADSNGEYIQVEETAKAFLLDTSAPETKLPDKITADPENPYIGILQGTIQDDLLLQNIEGTFDELMDVKVITDNADPTCREYVGTIDEEGNFIIKFPMKKGMNKVKLFVSDAAGNGTAAPAKEFEYNTEKPNKPKGTDAQLTSVQDSVYANEPFDIDVNFSGEEEIHTMTVDVTYDAKLTLNSITPASPEMKLSKSEGAASEQVEVQAGKKKVTFGIELNEPVKQGTLAHFNFTAAEPGTFALDIQNAKMLNGKQKEVKTGNLTGIQVEVKPAKTPEEEPDKGNDTTTPVEPPASPEPDPGTDPEPGNPADPSGTAPGDQPQQPEPGTDEGTDSDPEPSPALTPDPDQVSGSMRVTPATFEAAQTAQNAEELV